MLRRSILALALAAAVAAPARAADDPALYVGVWTGTWAGGDGSGGRFDLTFEKAADGKLAGGVSVNDPNGDYTAKFKTVAIDAGKFQARYDYAGVPGSEIVLAGALAGAEASGTWSLEAGGSAMAAGSWKTARK
jgi:hypothetical protein